MACPPPRDSAVGRGERVENRRPKARPTSRSGARVCETWSPRTFADAGDDRNSALYRRAFFSLDTAQAAGRECEPHRAAPGKDTTPGSLKTHRAAWTGERLAHDGTTNTPLTREQPRSRKYPTLDPPSRSGAHPTPQPYTPSTGPRGLSPGGCAARMRDATRPTWATRFGNAHRSMATHRGFPAHRSLRIAS